MASNLKPKRKAKIRPKHADYIQMLANLGYTFRMNLLDDSIEVSRERMTDALAATIRDQMRDAGFYAHLSAMQDAYIHEARRNPYHPVRDYLAGLQYDDGNYISQLAAYFKDKHSIFHTYLRRWLIGAVARAHTGAQNAMLVIEGKQDIGKSTFVRWLCPILNMYLDKNINPDNKDYDIFLITYWVWEVGELGATTRRADREALKSFISREKVDVRVPYGHYPITKSALASFIGTFNNEGGILSDPTGNRRFNVCSLTEIDWNYSTDVDVNMVWAEAQAAYFAGEQWRLTGDEKLKQQDVNEEFMVEDPIENLLRKHFTITRNNIDWIPTVDIMNTLQGNGLTGNLKANQMYLSATLKRMSLEKAKFNNVWGYRGIK